MSHQLGDRVRVAETYRFFHDWRTWSGFVVGLRVTERTGAITVDVSDHFPPRDRGDFTTDFSPDDLVPIT